jgi:cell division protein FtsN
MDNDAGASRAALAIVGLAVVIVIFAGGVLVGRQWSRPGIAAPGAAEGPRKPAGGRRPETEVERARDGAEKLTFYQTLTAPLVPPVSSPKPNGESKPKAAVERPSAAVEPQLSRPEPAAPFTKPATEERPRPGAAPVDSAPPAAAEPVPATVGAAAVSGVSTFSVQVGAFRTRAQADGIQRELRESGFEAYVTTLGTPDGHTRYRVRVGSYRTRGEADRAAERVRAERSLPTFVASD